MKVEELIEVDPEKMGGTPVFFGTRVPIKNFFDYLEGGDGLEVFLDHFPTVEREQALALLELMRERILGEDDLKPLVPKALAALDHIQPGTIVIIRS